MSNQGYIVAKKGMGRVRRNGTIAVFDADDLCLACCCKPKVLATYTIPENTITNIGTWDLTPYQGDDMGTPGGYWRLRNNYMSYVPEQKGCIDKNGKLTGLPDSISSTAYKYTWVFTLEIGCPTEDGKIKWPSGTTDAYPCL